MWIVLTVIAASALLNLVVWHYLFSRAIDRKPPPAPPLDRYPSVTVIRPIRGLDVGLEENLRAALDTGYPGEVETLFVFDEQSDPGLPVAREMVDEHNASGRPGSAAVLIAGLPPEGITGKLNAMIHATTKARGELIAYGDSDTRPDRQLLRVLVEALLAGSDKTGCTFSPVVVTYPDSGTVGDVGYAMMLNSLYGPAVAYAARKTGELPFIMGQIMVFTRQALEAIGGVACAAGQLVDDMYIGQCVKKAGYANLMVAHPLSIVIGGLSFADFLRTYRRWIMFSRNGLPFAFTWPLYTVAVGFFAALFIFGFALAAGETTAAFVSAIVVLAQGISSELLQRRFGSRPIPWRHAWILWALFILAPFVFLSMLWRNVVWRGRDYQLALTTRLK